MITRRTKRHAMSAEHPVGRLSHPVGLAREDLDGADHLPWVGDTDAVVAATERFLRRFGAALAQCHGLPYAPRLALAGLVRCRAELRRLW